MPLPRVMFKHNPIFMIPPSQKEWDKGVAVIVAPKDIRKQEDQGQGQWHHRQNYQNWERHRQENTASKKRVRDGVNWTIQVAQSINKDHLVKLSSDTAQEEENQEGDGQ